METVWRAVRTGLADAQLQGRVRVIVLSSSSLLSCRNNDGPRLTNLFLPAQTWPDVARYLRLIVSTGHLAVANTRQLTAGRL